MDHTQLGRAGELALALYGLVSSDGDLEMFAPIADDDHVDATAGRRGGIPAIALQIKTASMPDRDGTETARKHLQHADLLELANRPEDAAKHRRIAQTLQRISAGSTEG